MKGSLRAFRGEVDRSGFCAQAKATMAWEDVEELVIHWLVDAGLDAWSELTEIEMEQEDLRRKDCECSGCRNIAWTMGLELQEMFKDFASDLLPEVRLRAANRSARAFRDL